MYNCFGDLMETVEKKIIEVLDSLRPYLISDGGNIEFIKFEDGNVYVKMLGSCANCEFIDYTLKESVEEVLVNTIPEVKSVIQINDN